MKQIILILLTTVAAHAELDPVDEIDGVPVRRAIPIGEAKTYDATPSNVDQSSSPSNVEIISATAADPKAETPSTLEMAYSVFTFLGVILCIYFFPWVVAVSRHHHNNLAIFVLNLLLGWTFIGWVAALVWATTDPKRV